jgi:aryl-alcohol dehydrogenase-like predicted oxidoreductase
VTAPIASATSIAQLDELMRAAELEIDDESDDLLRKASANKPAPG